MTTLETDAPPKWTIKKARHPKREEMLKSINHHWVGKIRQFLASNWLIARPPITSSSIRNWTKCRRYYLLKDRLMLRRRSSYSEPLALGNIFHDYCEQRFKGSDHDLAAAYTASKAKSEREIWDTARANGFGWAYFALWSPVPNGWEIVAVEERVSAHVGRGIAKCSAKFDLVVRDPSNGYLWIVDHKTTSGSPTGIVPALPFDTQTHHYKLHADAKWPGQTVVGIIHNIIQKCGIKARSRGNEDETPEEFTDRIKDWYCDKAGFDPRKNEEPPETPLATQPIIRSSVLFGVEPPREYSVLVREVSRGSRVSPIPENYPKCHNMYTCCGHGSKCEFLEACRTSSNKKMFQVLNEHYEQEDVYERLFGESS